MNALHLLETSCAIEPQMSEHDREVWDQRLRFYRIVTQVVILNNNFCRAVDDDICTCRGFINI